MAALAIRAAGMVTPAGLDAATSLAAFRAGTSALERTNLWDPESATYLAAGKVALHQWWVGVGKLADLAAPAIQECLTAAAPTAPADIPVLLGVAGHDRPFRFPDLDAAILPAIEERLGFRLHRASRVVTRDRVSALVALRVADGLLAHCDVPYVIVAAVDSLLDVDLKEHYRAKGRLLTPKNANGFSLGEAAGAVLLARPGDGEELVVLGIGIGHDRAAIGSDVPASGDGMAGAIQEALTEAGLTIEDVQHHLADRNGEQRSLSDVNLAIERLGEKSLLPASRPIEFTGDVGAAIGPLLLGLGFDAGRNGYAPGPQSLFTLANDDGERAAVVARFAAPGAGGSRRKPPALSPPRFLRAADVQDESLRFAWDDWRDIPEAQTADAELVRRFDQISDRAVLAFMCATAEWIVHRFSRHCPDPAPHAYLEVAWATTVSLWYGALVTEVSWEKHIRRAPREWYGPVKSPIVDALQLLEEAIQDSALESTDPASRAGRLAALATYVMTDPTPYTQWCEAVMTRLESVYPLDREDQRGDVVPREALDPDFDFHVEQTEMLVNQFFARLDTRHHPFLSPPEKMITDGFEGRPYIFDLATDRKDRLEE